MPLLISGFTNLKFNKSANQQSPPISLHITIYLINKRAIANALCIDYIYFRTVHHLMKVISYMVPLLTLLFSFFYNNNPFVVKEEAKQAYELLNAIRANPAAYAGKLHLNSQLPINHKALRWNDTLAKVAEAKAMDMAKRNYFNHVDPEGYGINYQVQQSGYTLNADWTKNKKENFFESISVGAMSGREAIEALILDADDTSFGHRDHLLGIGDWNNSLVDIGIGFVKCDAGQYKSYACIVIAKHNW